MKNIENNIGAAEKFIGFKGATLALHLNGETVGVSLSGVNLSGVYDTLGNHGLELGSHFGNPEGFRYTVCTVERLTKTLTSIVWHRLASKTFSGAGEFDAIARTLAERWVASLPTDRFLPRECVVNPDARPVGVLDGMAS